MTALFGRAINGDVDATIELLRATAHGDLDREDVRLYLMSSAREILSRIDDGKRPQAEQALLLTKPNNRPQTTRNRNYLIARDIAVARFYGQKQSVYWKIIGDHFNLGQESIKSIEQKTRDSWEIELSSFNKNNPPPGSDITLSIKDIRYYDKLTEGRFLDPSYCDW